MNNFISNSKEVYKRIPNTKSSDNPLRAVQGLYVSNKYRPLLSIDAALHLQSISTDKAKVYDMTTQNIDSNENVIWLTDIDVSDITYTDYNKSFSEYSNDNAIQLVDFNISDPEIIEYDKKYSEYENMNLIQITDINIDDISIVYYNNDNGYISPDGIVSLIDISTTPATISIYDNT